jgi:hypothetical protein
MMMKMGRISQNSGRFHVSFLFIIIGISCC